MGTYIGIDSSERELASLGLFPSPSKLTFLLISQCVRSTLIEKTGQDIDPEEVENLVQTEIKDIQKKRKQEEARVIQELRSGGIFRCRSTHGGI